jgi:phage gpG-like protein
MGNNVQVTSRVFSVKNAAYQAMVKAAEMVGGIVEGHAKEYCPVNTGNLRNSITYVFEDDPDHPSNENEVTVIIGTNVEYAPYVELGHNQEVGRYVPAIKKRLVKEFVAARPFLAPAMNNHLGEIEQAIMENIE